MGSRNLRLTLALAPFVHPAQHKERKEKRTLATNRYLCVLRAFAVNDISLGFLNGARAKRKRFR